MRQCVNLSRHHGQSFQLSAFPAIHERIVLIAIPINTTTAMSQINQFLVINAFYRVILLHAITGVVIALDNQAQNIILPPDDIIKEYIDEVVERYGLESLFKSRKRRADDTNTTPAKRKMVKYNRARARQCVMQDWMGPTPTFDDKQFERTFRIKRNMVDGLLGKLVNHDPFWTTTIDSCGRQSIDPVVKFLTAMKLVCYGVSFSAFKDYYQMGESTARLCMAKLCRGIYECEEISAFYLRFPSKSDARNIVNLHKRVHGIPGMLGSLDVTKVHWANCPTAWKGQFEGKEGVPTIGLEAVADYNCWIWHSAFGFPGTMNDLNIWDRSPLFASMTDGTHNEIDIPFVINGEVFQQLFYLVDGIYPLLARFVSSVKDPTNVIDQFFTKKQEAARKDVERAFGIWKKKFLSVGKSVTYHERDGIFYLVKATIVLHNMMVQVRIENDDLESDISYETGQDTEVSSEHSNIVVGGYDATSGRDNVDKYTMIQRRWEDLYDMERAIHLSDSIKRHVYKEKHGDDAIPDADHFFDGYDPLSF
jgi:hypothetical protein